jgi:DnaJ-domain-containing protein 1
MMLQKYLLRKSIAPLFMNSSAYYRMNFSTAAAVSQLEKDYYTILDISTTATPEQIKEQYRKLAKKYHPDVRTADKT